MIENAQDDDIGYYECVASNQMGEVKSRKAKMVSEEQQNEAINEAGMLVLYTLNSKTWKWYSRMLI